MSILQKSPHQSFRVTQLAHSIAICEALNGDRYDWGNAEDDQPAFLVSVDHKVSLKQAIATKFLFRFISFVYVA